MFFPIYNVLNDLNNFFIDLISAKDVRKRLLKNRLEYVKTKAN